MEHHGLFTDISNSFPGSGVLPNTNVKYHHHLPQIPPQPPPPPNTGQGGNPQLFLPLQQQQQQQQPIAGYGQQQHQQHHHQQSQQAQSQHVESDPIGSGLYHDTAGLFDTTSALCTNNSSSNYSNVNNNNGSNVNNSKTIEFTSRKFETNTGDSITYNINNINTNIVNNISGGSLGANGVQGLNPTQAAITGGGSDLLGNTQFSASGGGNAQISFNKEGDTNPTIINISNNNHNIMAPPYPYPYQAKISGVGALNDLNTKFGANPSWAGNGSTHSGTAEFALDNSVINNFEAKNPTKYHTSRSSYRYQQDYGQPAQQAQPTTAHYQHNYGLYHPEGAQATPIQQSNGHHGYEPYPQIVRSKYPMMDEVNRYGRTHQVHSVTHSQNHHDLMYNERSRYSNNFTSGYIPPAAGYYSTAQPSSKNMLNPSVDYFNSNYIKQVPPLNAHQASHYIPSRTAYSHQNPTIPGYHHHQSYINHVPAYEDPYRHRPRHHTLKHHYNDGQQAYPNYPVPGANLAYSHNQKLPFSKSINDFYSPNPPTNSSHHYPMPLTNPTTPTVHHAPHYGIKYTSQTIVPPMPQPKPSNHPVPISQPAQKSTNNCFYDTPNPVIDMNHPLVDLEEQINSSKILKSNRENTGYETNHALNYDCQQKYLMNRHLYSKTTTSYPHTPTSTDGYVPNGSHINPSANLTNYGYSTVDEFVMGSRNFTHDENLKDKNLRDYLSSWNETEEEDTTTTPTSTTERKETNNNQPAHQNFESCKYLQQALEEQLPPLHGGVIVENVQNGTGNLPDILIDLEKTKDENPKVGQETTEVGEKLYILETYDVPHSELNKYKHLSVINELPKNVVPIHDSADSLKFLEEIESNRDKYYQTELESEVVYDERKKDEEKKEEEFMPTIVLDDDEPKTVSEEEEQSDKEEESSVSQVVQQEEAPVPEDDLQTKEELQKETEEADFKVPRYIPKYRKRRHQYDGYDYPRFPKRARRSSIEDFLHCEVRMPKSPKPPTLFNPKQLFSICVAALNSREYRRYAKADLARRQELTAKQSLEKDTVEQVQSSNQLQGDVTEEKTVVQETQPEVCKVEGDIFVQMECCEENKNENHVEVRTEDSVMTSNRSNVVESCEENIEQMQSKNQTEKSPEAQNLQAVDCRKKQSEEDQTNEVEKSPQMEVPEEDNVEGPAIETEQTNLPDVQTVEKETVRDESVAQAKELNDDDTRQEIENPMDEETTSNSGVESGNYQINKCEEIMKPDEFVIDGAVDHESGNDVSIEEENSTSEDNAELPGATEKVIQQMENAASLEVEGREMEEIAEPDKTPGFDNSEQESEKAISGEVEDSQMEEMVEPLKFPGQESENATPIEVKDSDTDEFTNHDESARIDDNAEKESGEDDSEIREYEESAMIDDNVEQEHCNAPSIAIEDNETEDLAKPAEPSRFGYNTEQESVNSTTIEIYDSETDEHTEPNEPSMLDDNSRQESGKATPIIETEALTEPTESSRIDDDTKHELVDETPNEIEHSEEEEILKTAEPTRIGNKTDQESDYSTPIEVEDSETDDDDEVFEQPTELQFATPVCERASVIVDEAKQIAAEWDDDSDEEDEWPSLVTTVPRIDSVMDEKTSAQQDEEAALCPSEGQRVPVIQKTKSYESVKTDELMEADKMWTADEPQETEKSMGACEPMETDEPVTLFNPPSLRDLTNAAFKCYRVLYDYQRVAHLRTLCYEYLLANDMLPQPQSLQKLCEQFICSNRHLFIIEEVNNEPPRLQEICQKVLNETNIIIDVNDLCIIGEEAEQEKTDHGRVFIVEDDHGSIEDLLRESESVEGDVIVVSDDVGDEHEIFVSDAAYGEDVQVVLESVQSLSDSENEIYRNVEREIERMMTTSSDEEDEASKRYVVQMGEDELDNEFFSFVGDDECIQYEEIIPVNKQEHRRESLISELQGKYIVPKGRSLTARLKLLRKYVYYQRFIKTRDHGMQSKRKFFSRKLYCLRRKIEAMRRSVSVSVIDDDSDTNDSSFSGISSSSSSSSNSSSSTSSGSASSSSSESEEAAATESETIERSTRHASDDSSSQSSRSSVGERLIETNNNQLDLRTLTKPAKVESQQIAKEEDNSSNSSDSRSRGFVRRLANISPLVKKKKLSFEESLLSIEQMYKKTNSPTQSTSSPSNSNSSSPVPVRTRIFTKANCGPNVVVNVNNNREAPRKLIIPSYKIFNQDLVVPTPTEVEPSRPSRQPIRRRNSSVGSSSSSSTGTRYHLVNCTQRSSGLIRVNYPNKPANLGKPTAIDQSNGSNAVTRPNTIPAGFDRRIPYVRLERIDYVEKLAEQYRQQQRQQQQRHQQEQFAKLRQRRKSTFS